MADLTNKIERLNGINLPSNYVLQNCIRVEGGITPEALAVATHDIMKMPADQAIIGLTVVSLDTAESSGAATVQFSFSCDGGNEQNIGSAITKANLAVGTEHALSVSTLTTYVPVSGDVSAEEFYKSKHNVLKMTVGTAAFTKLDLLLIVDVVPIGLFVRKG